VIQREGTTKHTKDTKKRTTDVTEVTDQGASRELIRSDLILLSLSVSSVPSVVKVPSSLAHASGCVIQRMRSDQVESSIGSRRDVPTRPPFSTQTPATAFGLSPPSAVGGLSCSPLAKGRSDGCTRGSKRVIERRDLASSDHLACRAPPYPPCTEFGTSSTSVCWRDCRLFQTMSF
jgi:hypothetical protein